MDSPYAPLIIAFLLALFTLPLAAYREKKKKAKEARLAKLREIPSVTKDKQIDDRTRLSTTVYGDGSSVKRKYTLMDNGRTRLTVKLTNADGKTRENTYYENENGNWSASPRLKKKKQLNPTVKREIIQLPSFDASQWATLSVIALLIIALLRGDWNDYSYPWQELYELPYGFYTFLRLSASVLGVWFIYRASQYTDKPLLILMSIAFVLLYQPIVKVELEHETWCWINLLTIPTIIYLSLRTTKREHREIEYQHSANDSKQTSYFPPEGSKHQQASPVTSERKIDENTRVSKTTYSDGSSVEHVNSKTSDGRNFLLSKRTGENGNTSERMYVDDKDGNYIKFHIKTPEQQEREMQIWHDAIKQEQQNTSKPTKSHAGCLSILFRLAVIYIIFGAIAGIYQYITS